MKRPVLVVTGGSRGIGRAVAQGAVRRGFAVCFSFLSDTAAAEAVVAGIEGEGGAAVAVQGDNGDPADVAKLFAAADRLGRLAALVNNVGIVAPVSRVIDMSVERLETVLRTNALGPILCAQQAIARMSTLRGGCGGGIVNLSSVTARLGGAGNSVDYAASKGAVEAFTRGLASEVAAEHIHVNAVAPGMIATDIHANAGDADRLTRLLDTVPLQRVGGADEVAAAILWLLSPEASYITGTVLTVSGGR